MAEPAYLRYSSPGIRVIMESEHVNLSGHSLGKLDFSKRWQGDIYETFICDVTPLSFGFHHWK
jgi:hypothetical protein